MANEGMMLLVGLGALLLLGGRKTPSTVQETITGSGSGFPGMFPPEGSPAFDIAGYVDTLFSQTATVPEQTPTQYFFYPSTVVTSSGVPAPIETPPDLITDTTKVQIGGDGGETITESAAAIKRSEDIAKQEFAAAANADLRTSPAGSQYFWQASVEANRIEEARQKQFAADLIARNRAAQAEALRSREAQEGAVTVSNEFINPTINIDAADPDWTFNTSGIAGQPIGVSGSPDLDVDFGPEYSETFVISAGMDSPTVYFSEDEQPVGVAVHEITAQYDIGF